MGFAEKVFQDKISCIEEDFAGNTPENIKKFIFIGPER